MDDKDREKLVSDYRERYHEYGYSPKTLGWDKGKQDIRFEVLTSQWDIKGKKILDIGCGFGDLNCFLKKKGIDDYEYVGIDMVEELILEARKRNSQNGKATISYICGDFLDIDIPQKFDYVIASGIFNRKFIGNLDNYSFIERCIDKSVDICVGGVAFDFLSDKVDYRYNHTFHSSPERLIGYAYKKSRRIMLRNDYMPFEFAVFIFKDDSFDKHDTMFCRYKDLINYK
ncbi:methyltransferase domain-containing protein [Anaerovibrio sp. RM50]|uniref:methyltransferase domain-containing protein n=1 Tax=Anaerovibrio sp. RM50 TaxID=1200557 RepID=UPI0006861B14|nr:methyltransferase domain-containing protein [Anaerovibrio sp. RM50]